MCSKDYDILKSNSAADVLMGMGSSVVGKKCYEVFHRLDKPCAKCPLLETIVSGTMIPFDSFDERFNEYFEEWTHPIITDDGTFHGFIINSRNVTATKQIEEQHAQAKKLAAIGQISAGVAHDFNNVLTGILGNVEKAIRLVDNPEIERHLKIINSAARQGAATVRRMQEFTRGKRTVPLEQLDLKALLTNVIELTRPKWEEMAQSKGALIQDHAVLHDGIQIMGNPTDIRNAVTNVIFNAVDAMPDGGLLTFKTDLVQNQVHLRIADTGFGMTEELQEKVLDPFFTTKGVNGTGLGLSEVYGVMTRHNGDVKIKSDVGKGTEVTLAFPIHMSTTSVSESSVPEPAETPGFEILLVDDEDFILEVIEEALQALGHTVTSFQEPLDAIEAFRKGDYDLVITDMGMPRMSGEDLANNLRVLDPTIPILLLSGWTIDLDNDSNLSRVIDLTLTKPVSENDLKNAIQQVILPDSSD